MQAIAGLLIALVVQPPHRAWATARASAYEDEEVCDSLADYFLGMEDYPEAIRRHRIVVREHPDNALAHYHLGFAYGVMGDHRHELSEYRKAIDLGFGDWQLFLNLGLLYLETGNTRDATEVLRLATLLGPSQPETHFNLALAYERDGVRAKNGAGRRGSLEMAEQEALFSLEIDPDQPDARNTLGTIYAEEGEFDRAMAEWTELAAANPGYTPARTNLQILRRAEAESRKNLHDTSFTGAQ
ncbi:MAG TPA: tetratricopeptide repeat protein [Candidatus Binataceae bacterium]|nr:tetratricopeptide repeat protein [Candidatus Binataceae bacterium]